MSRNIRSISIGSRSKSFVLSIAIQLSPLRDIGCHPYVTYNYSQSTIVNLVKHQQSFHCSQLLGIMGMFLSSQSIGVRLLGIGQLMFQGEEVIDPSVLVPLGLRAQGPDSDPGMEQWQLVSFIR